ncbi:LuxR C-terminal-related transcriptional regulator [Lentzea sp. JNUCC 0626]|uniref:helix-turn-helix transcriptional regulator n=1 Tax=Lentzea sp. JNUCC 0626 TaxID=3367513 RepID=UPI00374A788B
MDRVDWQDVARFGEVACGSLSPATVLQRTLPELVRALRCDSGAVQLLDRHYRGRLSTVTGAPVQMLLDFEIIAGPAEPYFQRSTSSRFPIHDAVMYPHPSDHLSSPVGRLLNRYGFDHCLLVSLVVDGRPIGKATFARRLGQPPFSAQEQGTIHRMAKFLALGLSNAVTHQERVGGAPSISPSHRVDTVDLSSPSGRPATCAPRSGDVLTRREREVLVLATSGLTNAELAVELGIAVNTVKQHVRHAFHKIGVRSRLEALRYLQNGS